jgi:hypothetical protein
MNKRNESRQGWIALVVLMIVGTSVIAGCMTQTSSDDMTQIPTGEMTQAPADEITQAPSVDMTEIPSVDLTQAPTDEITQTPSVDMTELPPNDSGPDQGVTVFPEMTVPAAIATRPGAGSVTALDFNQFFPFLPEAPTGWTADDPWGDTINETVIWTFASRSYSWDNKDGIVSIMDSAYYDVGPWVGWGGGQEISGNGYYKTGIVAGFPSWESYDNSSNSYETSVSLNDRFMVTITMNNVEKSDLDLFVNSIDYQGIAALK